MSVLAPPAPPALSAADIDGDGDIDVLGASSLSDDLAWYENNGSGIFTTRIVNSNGPITGSVVAADLDGDGDVDILEGATGFSTTRIAWYENNGAEVFTQRVISTDGAASVFAADADGDGDLDVLAPSSQNGGIVWYENDAPLDLAGVQFGATPDHALNGQIEVTFDVQNLGTVPAGAFQTHIVWSLNDVIGDGDDVFVVASIESFTGLAPGATVARTVSVQLDKAALYAHSLAQNPSGQSVGTVSDESSRLFLVVDIGDTVQEGDETNNSGVGHLIDSDDITYFPWDKNSNGVVEPLEALTSIQAIGTNDAASDFDGSGIVSPLEALSAVQRIGYVRASVLSKTGKLAVAVEQVPTIQLQRAGVHSVLAAPVLAGSEEAVTRLVGRKVSDATDADEATLRLRSRPVDDDEEDQLFAAEVSADPVVIFSEADDAINNNPFHAIEWLDVI